MEHTHLRMVRAGPGRAIKVLRHRTWRGRGDIPLVRPPPLRLDDHQERHTIIGRRSTRSGGRTSGRRRSRRYDSENETSLRLCRRSSWQATQDRQAHDVRIDRAHRNNEEVNGGGLASIFHPKMFEKMIRKLVEDAIAAVLKQFNITGTKATGEGQGEGPEQQEKGWRRTST